MLAGCASADPANRAGRARAELAAADALVAAAAAVPPLPDWPAECAAPFRAGVSAASRMDAAILAYDAALGRANARAAACAEFYRSLKAARAQPR